MAGFGYACGVLLAAVLVVAATAKLAAPGRTAAGFRALGLPAASVLARSIPLAELAVAVALLAAPRAGGVAALALLATFSAVLARTLAAGLHVPCACFGTTRAEPVSGADLVRNLMLGALAAAAAFPARPVVPTPLEASAAAAVGLASATVIHAARARLTTAHRRSVT